MDLLGGVLRQGLLGQLERQDESQEAGERVTSGHSCPCP
jgi:hypothetical protein